MRFAWNRLSHSRRVTFRKGIPPVSIQRIHMAKDNKIDALLRAAVNEPGCRPAFYRALLDAEVYVLVDEGCARGKKVVPAGSLIQIVQWCVDGDYVTPFFSSVEAVREGAPYNLRCVIMPVRDLFESQPGARLHLNPNCQFTCRFEPHEVASLLASGSVNIPESRVTEESRAVVWERESNPPQAMLASLRVLYQGLPPVQAAYLVRMHDVKAGQSSLVIGLRICGDQEAVLNGTASVVADTSSAPVDLLVFPKHEEDLEHGISTVVEPFYQRPPDEH